MRYDFHRVFNFPFNWLGAIVFAVIIIAIIILIIKRNKQVRFKRYPEMNKLMDLLGEKHSLGEISDDEFNERKMILEDEYWLDTSNHAQMILKERYARCEINSREYVKIREELK
ncbi:MAG: SHOCT domain-containing protein [Saccharofermentanales bacterium]